MDVYLCGVRGSVAAPGVEFARYGGNTSCVAVAADAGHPTLVIDAGTGIRRVSALLGGRAFVGTILFSHLHWDHTQGLPFFAAADHAEARVHTLMPDGGQPAQGVLARFMTPPYFPIEPQELAGSWHHDTLAEGVHLIEGFEVVAREVPHKGGRTFGYRISDGRSSMAYISDHEPTVAGPGPDGLGVYHDAILDLARDVDLLLHDAQFRAEEMPAMAGFGHSTVEYAVGLARHARARRLLLFHHAPGRTDNELDDIVASLPTTGDVGVGAAAEGEVVRLGPGRG